MDKLSQLLSPMIIIYTLKGSPGAAITPSLADLFLVLEIDTEVGTVFTAYRHKFSSVVRVLSRSSGRNVGRTILTISEFAGLIRESRPNQGMDQDLFSLR